MLSKYLEELIKKIKEKKELSGTADSVVKETLNTYLKKYNILLGNLSPKEQKIIIKEIRSQLRSLTGQYQKNIKYRPNLINNPTELLKTHTSTFERQEDYPNLKALIKKINPKSILDLGCGLNPIALATPKIKYFASDIKEDELEIIKKFFAMNKIKGKTFIYDLRKINSDLPKADLCFIFKVLDIIDKNLAEKILVLIPCKKILVSFSTKKLSGKKMNKPNRDWFEKILKRLNFEYNKTNTENEVFYLIDKINSQ